MATRFDDLARREQELAAREASLNAKAEHIRKVSIGRERKLDESSEGGLGRTELTFYDVNLARS